ncbi:hypothetical protein PV336_16145 [Streptomyces sp. MI02-2A]|uniref:hypothetical protein n=1 Tax=Streptomyces sp. MI02-2A TaxID=3028688 RepID=UPI0029B92EBE|nr:hypothetical protein [Streptomyces sp. MI02-2A]MDX3260752.1 hypothetical protein [Streptomyces sp. MI02-2A]
MAIHGPQFEQTSLPNHMSDDYEVHRRDQVRAQYHLNRDTPLHLQVGRPGALRVTHPVPHPGGIANRVTSIGSSRDQEQIIHPEERNNYPVPEGQMVMGPPHNPQQFGHVDGHGNVVDPKITDRWFEKHGPQMSRDNEEFWDKHATFQRMSTSSVLHTGQTAFETGSHSYITGHLDPEHPHVKVVVQGGTSYIADAHHRLAEARGRGDTHVGAHVLNLDQFKADPQPKIKKKTPAEDVVEHLVKHHGYSPQMNPKHAHGEHDSLHRFGLHEHEHG